MARRLLHLELESEAPAMFALQLLVAFASALLLVGNLALSEGRRGVGTPQGSPPVTRERSEL